MGKYTSPEKAARIRAEADFQRESRTLPNRVRQLEVIVDTLVRVIGEDTAREALQARIVEERGAGIIVGMPAEDKSPLDRIGEQYRKRRLAKLKAEIANGVGVAEPEPTEAA